MTGFIKDKEIEIIYPDNKTIEIFQKIKEIDQRIEFMDAMHIACAKSNGIKVFVTLDKHYWKTKKFKNI